MANLVFKRGGGLVRQIVQTTCVPGLRNISLSSMMRMRRPLEDDSIENYQVESLSAAKVPPTEDLSKNYSMESEYEGPTEKSINQVTLLGRVGMDPQIRGSEDKPVTTFSLATNSSWRNVNQRPGDSEWTHKTEWHNVVVFKPGLRESVYNNLMKGSRVHVSGRLMYGEYVDTRGVKRQTTSIVCEDIIYLTKKHSD